MEESVGQGGCKHGEHIVATRTLSKDGDVIFIATELRNIALHPAKCGNDVKRAKVRDGARPRIERRMAEPAKRS